MFAGRFGTSFVITISTGFIFGYLFANVFRANLDPFNLKQILTLENGSTLLDTNDTDLEAQRLSKKVKVLCWIMTNPSNNKSIHIKQTWGQRCDKLLFMSSTADPSLPSIALPNVQEGRDFLWAKTKEAFKYIHQHHFEEADWFLKADDDTYVIVENLRFMLKDVDPNHPIYFGCKFKTYVKQGYMSGGSGYVLSREALRRFVEHGIVNETKCSAGHSGYEDVQLGKCMENLGVEAGDSRDAIGRHRFIPLNLQRYITSAKNSSSWYWDYIYYPQETGMRCCSDLAVCFGLLFSFLYSFPNPSGPEAASKGHLYHFTVCHPPRCIYTITYFTISDPMVFNTTLTTRYLANQPLSYTTAMIDNF